MDTLKIDYHFLREKVVNDTLLTKYVSTTFQLADIFTKILPKSTFHFF